MLNCVLLIKFYDLVLPKVTFSQNFLFFLFFPLPFPSPSPNPLIIYRPDYLKFAKNACLSFGPWSVSPLIHFLYHYFHFFGIVLRQFLCSNPCLAYLSYTPQRPAFLQASSSFFSTVFIYFFGRSTADFTFLKHST